MRRWATTSHGSPVMYRRVLRLVARCVTPLHNPVWLLVSVGQSDTAGISRTGQSLDNYMTVERDEAGSMLSSNMFIPCQPKTKAPAFRAGGGPAKGTPAWYSHPRTYAATSK